MLWPSVAVLVAVGVYYFNVFWRFVTDHFKSMRMTAEISGPAMIPFIGNAHQISNTSFGFTGQLLQWCREATAKGEHLARVWIGPKLMLMAADGQTVKAIVDSNVEIVKGSDYDFFLPWLGTGLLISSGPKWKSRRKMLTPTFHFQMLEGYVEVFDSNSNLLSRILESHAEDGKEFDIFPFIKRCALDIICETAMGTKMNAQINTDSEYFRAVERISVLGFDYFFRAHNWFLPYWYGSGKGFEKNRLVKLLTDFTQKVIMERVESRKNNPDMNTKRQAFLDMLLDMQGLNQLTYDDIKEEVDTFMFEGHDTTSSGIGWTLWSLACHPEFQAKVHEELDDHFGDSDRDIVVDDLKELKYLELCIKEAMRLFPPVPAVTRILQNDFVLDNRTIPKGTNIVICPLAIHRNPHVYKNADSYDPDNFLPERIAERHPYDYIPFSAGPRNCIGQKFALYEEKTMVAWILRKFKLSTTHKFEKNRFGIEVILRPEMGYPISLSPRA
ncbi:hypothetical protein L596_019588 [Steinernema carpocapsae]|uniref:Cytochrome P450 n=1 Tax=Steinernema carpocapsae TaxID=34508 RepID=A0A4U5MRG6_STECR|nr:hypothetical protein L596_019588 [Steinernema carpocapsae]